MKIRSGFVSNSSSSSFVVLLPENFLEKVDYIKIVGDDDEFPLEQFKKTLENIVSQKGFWDGDDDIFPNTEYDDEIMDIIHGLFEPYVLTEIDVSSDSGSTTIIDIDDVKKIIKLDED